MLECFISTRGMLARLSESVAEPIRRVSLAFQQSSGIPSVWMTHNPARKNTWYLFYKIRTCEFQVNSKKFFETIFSYLTNVALLFSIYFHGKLRNFKQTYYQTSNIVLAQNCSYMIALSCAGFHQSACPLYASYFIKLSPTPVDLWPMKISKDGFVSFQTNYSSKARYLCFIKPKRNHTHSRFVRTESWKRNGVTKCEIVQQAKLSQVMFDLSIYNFYVSHAW